MEERRKLVKRVLKYYTKEALAAKLKVSVFSIIRWEDGTRKPSFATFYFLKQLLKRAEKKGE